MINPAVAVLIQGKKKGMSVPFEGCAVRSLTAEFLRTVDAGEPVSPFFGSWLEICGKSQTGYDDLQTFVYQHP